MVLTEIKIKPLAFESFGVRSMATFVETSDLKVLIDPGTSLGPRFRLPPHELEYKALAQTRKAIQKTAKKADVLVVSHYHFDHYTPNFEENIWLKTKPEFAEELYSNKVIFAKDAKKNINFSQRRRGYMFYKLNEKIAKKIEVADGRFFQFDNTLLKFSTPVFHGPADSKLGWVLVTTIRTEKETFIHAPDVQGPVIEETLSIILKEKPDVLFVGGPPTYLAGFKYEYTDLVVAQKNLIELAKKLPVMVVDHHLLRDLNYKNYLQPIIDVVNTYNHKLLSAAEFIGKEPKLLEAHRKELHSKANTI